MLDIANALFEVYYAVFGGFCLQYFLGNFLECRGSKRRQSGLGVAAAYAVCSLCIGHLCPYRYEDIRVIERQAALFGVTVLLALLFYRAVRAVTGYLLITFAAISQISFFLAYSVFLLGGQLYSLWGWCMEKGYFVQADAAHLLIRVTAVFLQIVLYGAYTVLCIGSLKKIVHSFRDKEHPIGRTELYFLIVPSAVGLLICMLLRFLMVTVENGAPKLLYHRHPALTMVVPVIMFLCLLSILYSVKLFQEMIALNRERNNRIIMERQIGSMQAQIAEMEHIHSGIRSMRHDMKNTLAVILRLAGQEGDSAELQEYLSELNRNFDSFEMRYKTGNAVVDTLLNMKSHELAHMMPEVKLYADKLLFTDNIVIGSYDIGVIVGNALDNAAEACGKMKGGGGEPFIRLSSFAKGKMFFIKVENSFEGKVVRKKGMEFPATDKPDKKTHGIGLANIKSTAEKYHGGVDWQAQDGVFTLTVMLKNERSTENEYR